MGSLLCIDKRFPKLIVAEGFGRVAPNHAQATARPMATSTPSYLLERPKSAPWHRRACAPSCKKMRSEKSSELKNLEYFQSAKEEQHRRTVPTLRKSEQICTLPTICCSILSNLTEACTLQVHGKCSIENDLRNLLTKPVGESQYIYIYI